VPSAPAATATGTSPAGVRNSRSPGPSRSASATAVATLACPQNETSALGLKYRTSTVRSSRATTNAVSE